MKRFVFGLARILEYRRKQEERYKQELQRATLLRKQGEARLAELIRGEQEVRESLRKLQETEMDVREVLLHQRHVEWVAMNTQKHANIAERLKQLESAARERTISASRQTRVLENLEYRRRTEYRDVAFSREQKDLDDIGVLNWRRRQDAEEKE